MRTASYFKSEILCLLLMARKADNKSLRTRVSVQTLVYELQKSEKSIRRYINVWLSRGVLERLIRGGNGKATLYAFNRERLEEWADHRSQRNDRRYSRETTYDYANTGQKQPTHRSQRNDRQSDVRSFRSNGTTLEVSKEHKSTTRPAGAPRPVAEIFEEALLKNLSGNEDGR